MKSALHKLYISVKENEYLLLTIAAFIMYLFLYALMIGKYPFSSNPYNTYMLQAMAWKNGHLDLGQDYPWLELAIYKGKYFCSFPPFPSYVLFLLSFVFGNAVPEYLVVLFFDLLALISLFKISTKLGCSPVIASFFSLFLMLGSNVVFILWNPAVWFIAQIMCFSLCSFSIFCALHNRTTLSLFCWAAAVGCRPFEAIFLPVIFFLCACSEMKINPDLSPVRLIIRKWYKGIPTITLAISYMILNYLRFDNIAEFGHNHLPEFTRAENGQFSFAYVSSNFKSLMHPFQFENDKLFINHFGDLNMFFVNPICLFAIVILITFLIKKNNKDFLKCLCIIILSCIYMFIIVMHRTMGAWQFGNRYSIDILPWVFYPCVLGASKYPKLTKFCIPLFAWGFFLNAVGSIIVYNY